ncbi:MAG: hypothetical protein JXM70_20670 [Pirellulales bacterium]|nr:hypothetical protein [Pirellulales bacterium]
MKNITVFLCSLDMFLVHLTIVVCAAVVLCVGPVIGQAFADDAASIDQTRRDRIAASAIGMGVYVPRRGGATALSAAIHAQADYVKSLGDYLESASFARRNNAIAAEQEMRNALQWVSTYFERRELNRAYRLKNNPGYLANEEKRQEVLDRRITKLFHEVLKGDVTREINWLLHELAGMTLPYQYLPGDRAKPDSTIDTRLSKTDLHKILLTDGGRRGGRMLTFPADTARVLETPWPRSLRIPELENERKQFETARDKMLADRAKGKRNWESEKSVMQACDALSSKFESINPREERIESYEAFAQYRSGQRYLKTLAAEVMRAITTQDEWVFQGVYRFEGDSVVELVQHMCQNGLEFAPPQPGSEGAYRSLFESLRKIYLHLGADDPNRDLDDQDQDALKPDGQAGGGENLLQ